MQHAFIYSFGVFTLSEWTTHALTDFAKHSLRQVVLNRFAELRERSFFSCGNHKQQTFRPAGSVADVPVARKLARKVEYILTPSALHRGHIEIDLTSLLEVFQQTLNAVLRLRIENSGKVVNVDSWRRKLLCLRERVYIDQEEYSAGDDSRQGIS